MKNLSNVLKLSVLFTAAAALSACGQPIAPVDTKPLPRTAADIKHRQHREYEVLMVKDGCKVGREVSITSYGSRISDNAITSICPLPRTAIQPDRIGGGLTFTVLRSKFGCEVGDLRHGNLKLATVTLCPAQGESSTERTVQTGKAATKQVVISQRRTV